MLSKFSIAHLKAFGPKQNISFAIPQNDRLGLTILVGKNNSGKSTLLNFLAQLFDEKTEIVFEQFDMQARGTPSMSCEYYDQNHLRKVEIVEEGKAYFKKHVFEKVKRKWRNTHYNTAFGDFVRIVRSRRNWSDKFNYSATQPSVNFERGERSRHLRDSAPLGQSLHQIQREGKKNDYSDLVRRVIPELCDWDISRILGQDFIVYVTEAGKEHLLSNSGDGLASIFRVCFTLFESNEGDTILLDEPELSLHPDGQKRLHRVIREYAKSRQIIVCTHSPYLVSWRDLLDGAQLVRVSQDSKGATKLRTVRPSVLEAVSNVAEREIKNRKLYDILAKELFFLDAVAFVEGQEDAHLLEAYFEKNEEFRFPIFGYGSGGAPHISNWLELARDLGLRAVGIYDDDQRSEAKKSRKRFESCPEIVVLDLGREDIRDKHLRDGKCATKGSCKETKKIFKTGYFDRNWRIHRGQEAEFQDFLRKVQSHLFDKELN